MTQPQDPRKHPLQDDEIALARVLRALPAGEPPAHLDAAILKAATDAVAAGSPAVRPRRLVKAAGWLPTWAIGTAAAAVLAVGVGMQLRPPLAPEALPQASLADAKREMPEARDRLSVDLVEPEREIVPMPAPPPTEESALNRVRTNPVPPPPPAPRAAAPAPAVSPEPFPEPVPAAPAAAGAPVREEAGAFAPPPASVAADQAYAEAQSLDTVEVSGSRLKRAETERSDLARREAQARERRDLRQQAQSRASAESQGGLLGDVAAKASDRGPGLPAVSEDSKLAAADWLERVRERRREGDVAGARESLRLFVKTYPNAPLPTDLARLR